MQSPAVALLRSIRRVCIHDFEKYVQYAGSWQLAACSFQLGWWLGTTLPIASTTTQLCSQHARDRVHAGPAIHDVRKSDIKLIDCPPALAHFLRPLPSAPLMRSSLFDFRVFGGCCAILAEERIYAHPRPLCNRMMPVVFSPRDDWSFNTCILQR